MPIDQPLIDDSIAYSKEKTSAATKTACPHIYAVSDFIYQPLLDKFLKYLDSYENWKAADPPLLGRQLLNWEFDTVVEEVHICMESITGEVNTLLSTNHSKFLGLNIWKDVSPYKIEAHTDNPVIGTSLQIYLNNCNANLATNFSYEGENISLPYNSNSGYIMNNDFKVTHWMTTPLPENFNRYSLYAIWKS
jgi:hypothetical protein